MDRPECAAPGRAGFLVERRGAQGSFLACSEGGEVWGYASDVPQNAKQRQAVQEARCPQCGGAVRFRRAKEKEQAPFLSCAAYPNCRGLLKFGEDGKVTAAAPAKSAGTCAQCGQPLVRRVAKNSGQAFLSCMGRCRDGSGCNAPTIWPGEEK
jgi:ssDNA-binding Zn-finger/Zn-ribbon topoisomerase 1